MERCAFILLLPILLSLSLSPLADASSNLLPLRSQENNEADDSVILQDASEQNSLLRLPSEKQNEMEIEVPQMVRRPWDGDQLPKVTHDWFSVAPRLREKESDFVSRPAERGGESILPLRDTERESDSIFLRGGRKGWRFGHPGAGCHHHHGGEMKFGHRRGYGNHFRFRPQFILSFFTVPGDARPHGEEAVPSSIRKFSGEFQPRDQNEEPELKPRERAFDRIGEGFPERVHSRPWGHHLRFRPQFPRSSSFPSSGDHGEEAVSSYFRSFSEESSLPGAENEELGKRVVESIGEGFPEREHRHSHGQWKWEFPNGEERKDGRHEDQAAPWMDWLRSFFKRY